MRATAGLVRTGCRATLDRELIAAELGSPREAPCGFVGSVLDSVRVGPPGPIGDELRESSGFNAIWEGREVLELGKRLYIGNIPFSATEEELRELFARHGTVTGVDLITDRETGRPRGFAFVEMEDSAAADAAIEAVDGSDLGGRNIRVNEAQERRGGGGRR